MSSHRAGIVITPRARAQLSDVLLHSEQEWGPGQVRAYARALGTAMLALAGNPYIGRRRDEIADGLRSYRVQKHVIFYRYLNGKVFVVQILRVRRDPRGADWDDAS
ncbi:MAG TPA: type II toxin-antitoxin system RelE/ParE family toxin [Mycobacterium sp.]|nr:type II toxin-antitoxin system RelE/ParE family toxin [Mycobacterium sp.]